MKDHEFLELLNLYLDHEITAADAARLEAEVQANPARRAMYRDYCRMQKACTLLAKDFADQPADLKVVAFEPQRSSWTPGWLATGGLAVAAACVALVLVNRSPTATPGSSDTTTATTVATGPTAADTSGLVAPVPSLRAPEISEPATLITRTVTTGPVRRSDARATLASVPLMLAAPTGASSEALLVAAQQNSQAQFEWMKNVQLTPIQPLPMDDLRLDARSPLQPASRTYSNGRPVQGAVEMTAFRFTR